MKSRWLLVVVVSLSSSAVLAQSAASAPPDAEAAVGREISAQQARTDVHLLWTLARLGLTTEQIAVVIPHLEQIQSHLNAISSRRAKAHGQQQTALDNARAALLERETPRQTTYDNIQRALRQVQLATQIEMEKIQQAEARIEAELTEQQLGLLEMREQRDARVARLRELEGEATAAAYIVKKLGEIRELLPDEYARVRLRVASEVAVKTEGPRSSRFSVYRQRVLSMMDQAYRWTVAEFQAKQPTLEQSVTDTLEIRADADAPSAEGLIPYEEYAEAIRAPRTLELLREVLARWGGEADE